MPAALPCQSGITGSPILKLAHWARRVRRFMFTLLSTPLFTPLGPEFSCCYRPSARANTPNFSLILTAALKWSTALRGSRRSLPARSLVGRTLASCAACPPNLIVVGLPALGGRARLYQATGVRVLSSLE